MPTREIEREILERLGGIVTTWGLVEQRISDIFVAMTGGSPAAMLTVTVDVSQNTIIGWIRTLLQVLPITDEVEQEIKEAIAEADELRIERNTLFHGIWTTNSAPNSAVVQTIRLDRTEIVKELVVTSADLDALINGIVECAHRLGAILKDHSFDHDLT